MKQKHMTAIAIACGLICAACIALFMWNVQGEADAARAEALARYGGEQVEALVATRDVVAGERLDLSAVETKLWVADLLPENAVRSTADAVGKTATSTIFKGEVITAGRFESDRESIDVPAGKQAVSVPAKAVQAVGGAIRAGMSIDIYSSGDSTTSEIARNVNVLDTSVGNSGTLTSSDNGWITIAVEPEKVQELIAASNKTTLYFTLPGAAVPSGNADLGDNGEGDRESKSEKGNAKTAEEDSRSSSGEAGASESSARSLASSAPDGPEGRSSSTANSASASSSASASAGTSTEKNAGGERQ